LPRSSIKSHGSACFLAGSGVDLDSVSAIVSIFMLGLGVGAITGGWLADRFQRHRIFIFSLIELTIAIFGIFSLDVIDSVGSFLRPIRCRTLSS
jgi:MFS family permease